MPASLHDLFFGLQSQIRAALEAGRKSSAHPGSVGDTAELNWRAMFEDYLPRRYQVSSKAFVLDADGSTSDHIDLIIHDRQYSTLLLNAKGVTYVPAESVYCVLEVKQELSKATLEYAAQKAASVRKLRRTSAPIPAAGSKKKLAPKKPFAILAGIVCLESAWSPPMGDAFKRSVLGLPEAGRISFGCALASGAFSLSGSRRPQLNLSAPDAALVFFYLTLLAELQALGTAPAIDFTAYRRAVES